MAEGYIVTRELIRLKLCDVQGRLFVLSTAYASESFIRNFMFSEVALHLDSPYSKLQCVGEEYLLEELEDERNLSTVGEKYDPEVLYWIGYLYRYWACYRNESSKTIFRVAPAKTMKSGFSSECMTSLVCGVTLSSTSLHGHPNILGASR